MQTVNIPLYLFEDEELISFLQRVTDITTNLEDENECAELTPVATALQCEAHRRTQKWSL